MRAASAFDASLVNLYVATFPIMVSFLLAIVLPWYAGANLYLTLLIGARAGPADPGHLRRRVSGDEAAAAATTSSSAA